MDRRRFLIASAAVTAALAGCGSPDKEEETDGGGAYGDVVPAGRPAVD